MGDFNERSTNKRLLVARPALTSIIPSMVRLALTVENPIALIVAKRETQ